MRQIAVAIAVVLLAFATSAGAESYEETPVRAEQGDAQAQFMLGSMYYNGKRVPQDYAEAEKWYRKPAEQGDAKSQSNLGGRYRYGVRVPQDFAEAVKWFRKAAEQGITDAQSNLGSMYRYGQGVPQDYVQAHAWQNVAAANGFSAAAERRDRTASEMTREQIAEAQKLAKQYFELYKAK